MPRLCGEKAKTPRPTLRPQPEIRKGLKGQLFLLSRRGLGICCGRFWRCDRYAEKAPLPGDVLKDQIEMYLQREESVEGGFEARALSHSIYTEADTLEAIRSLVKDAVQCHFDERDRPKLIRLHIVKDEVMAA